MNATGVHALRSARDTVAGMLRTLEGVQGSPEWAGAQLPALTSDAYSALYCLDHALCGLNVAESVETPRQLGTRKAEYPNLGSANTAAPQASREPIGAEDAIRWDVYSDPEKLTPCEAFSKYVGEAEDKDPI